MFEAINNLLTFNEETPQPEPEKVFESATLEDGTVIQWEGELAEGTAVFVVPEEGEPIAAPDGTHVVSNGVKVTTENGLVVAIETGEEMQKFGAVENFEKANEMVQAFDDATTLQAIAQVVKFMFLDTYGWRVQQKETEEKITAAMETISKFEAQMANNQEVVSKLHDAMKFMAEEMPAKPAAIAEEKEKFSGNAAAMYNKLTKKK
jgi:hypothetical protein